MRSMSLNKILFFFQNDFDQLLMVLANGFDRTLRIVLPVLLLNVIQWTSRDLAKRCQLRRRHYNKRGAFSRLNFFNHGLRLLIYVLNRLHWLPTEGLQGDRRAWLGARRVVKSLFLGRVHIFWGQLLGLLNAWGEFLDRRNHGHFLSERRLWSWRWGVYEFIEEILLLGLGSLGLLGHCLRRR